MNRKHRRRVQVGQDEKECESSQHIHQASVTPFPERAHGMQHNRLKMKSFGLLWPKNECMASAVF
jgi:hypothetical protein